MPPHFTVIANSGKKSLTVIQNGTLGINNSFLVVRNVAGQTLIKQSLGYT
jgi:hypothetical protein